MGFQRVICLLTCLVSICLSASINSKAADGSTAQSFKTCSRDDPNLNGCLNEAIQFAIRKLKDGYQPFFIPEVDPLEVPVVSMPDPKNRLASLTLIDYKFRGLGDVVCQNTSYTRRGDTHFRLGFDLLVPKAQAAGVYSMSANYLGTTPFNVGEFSFTMTDFRFNLILDGVLFRKQGATTYAFMTSKPSKFYGATLVNTNFTNQSEERNREWIQNPQEFLLSYKLGTDHVHTSASAYIANLVSLNVPFDRLWS